MKKGLEMIAGLFGKKLQVHGERRFSDEMGGAKRKENRVLSSNKGMVEFYAAFRRDVEVFRQKLPQLLEQCPGEYVAIFEGQIVAHRQNWEDLVSETQQRYPNKFVLLEKVVPRSIAAVDMDTVEG